MILGDKDMYDDYYGMYSEPSEADLIIDEAKEKIGGLLIDDAKQKAKEYAELGERIKEAKETIDDLNRMIRDRNATIEKLDEKIEVANASRAEKYLDAVCEKYTKGFKPNDKCYVIAHESETIVCPVCGGDRKFVGKNGKEFKCPHCYGSGVKTTFGKEKVEERTVREVWLKMGFDENRKLRIWNIDTVELYAKRSDGYFDPRSVEGLYKTREEAEQAIRDEQ